jgi:transposase
MKECSKKVFAMTAGLDLGDKYSRLCLIDTATGEVVEETRLRTNPEQLKRHFANIEALRVAIETGTHSPWVSRLLTECGHEVLVANARKVRLIYQNRHKSDKLDAEKLARLARLDANLLAPIEHRGEAAQADLALLRSRQALVKARTQLINHVRGTVKSFGGRLPKCSTTSFHKKVAEHLPQPLAAVLAALLASIADLTGKIKELEEHIEELAQQYPETEVLRQVHGVGALTALAFLLTLEDPQRFASSRCVGAFLGLTPGRDQSGERDPRERISKEGNEMLRVLLVQCAHHILREKSPDSDLQRHGQKIVARGGKYAKQQAAVAVARKLAVLLHRLWLTGEVYQPLYNSSKQPTQAPLAA